MNLFGTDGIRQTVGKSPFIQQDLEKLAYAIATWAASKYGKNINVLIANDTRESCDWIKNILKDIFSKHAISTYDAGVLPTPGIFHIFKYDPRFSFAIMISASHNTYQDNGLKIIDAKTGKLNLADELEITKIYYANNFPQDLGGMSGEAPLVGAKTDAGIYIDSIIKKFKPNFLKNKKIVLDTANGAAYRVAKVIFEKLGAQVIVINDKPDGKNINKNCGAVHTEMLQNKVKEEAADLGLAFDGDGDRVIAVNKLGQKKDGDDILAVLVENSEFDEIKFVVGTIMTNMGLEVYLKNKNIKLIRTAVGDKYIAEELNAQNGLLGGEQSGHIIIKSIINTGDGIGVGLKLLETICFNNNWDLKTFEKYPQLILNIKVNSKPDLSLPPFSEIIESFKGRLKSGRIIVRYSGTEPLLRIMVEEESGELAQRIANELADNLSKKL